MSQVEWGEYKLSKLFTSSNGDYDLQKKHINDKGEFVITAGLNNNGILGKTDVKAKVFDKNTITIDMFGNPFYRKFNYKMVTHARVFSLKPSFDMSEQQGLFIVSSLYYLNKQFGYENMCSWEKIKDFDIVLPTKNKSIDSDFINLFIDELEAQRIAELEAYLSVTGLKDTRLSLDEEQALLDFDKIEWRAYTYKSIFNNIKQGRRLKKDDQLPGDIPFVMSGTTNTGVVGYICNPVALFPKNAITIDIFGNTFYRDYAFGAGDDTGVYWSEQNKYSKLSMLFFTTTMEKSILNKYSYGKKLRSSQSYDLKMQLPIKDNRINFYYMETLISAIQKLVIKDVVAFADKKIEATKQVVTK